MVGLNRSSSVRDAPICPFDGKPCDGVPVLGAPACSVDFFGAVEGKSKTCPRMKSKTRFQER